MKRLNKIVRGVVLSLLALVVLIPSGLYVALSLESVQKQICKKVENELSAQLGVDVSIKHISISPFSRLMLHDVVISDGNGNEAITARRLGAGFNLASIVFGDRIEIYYASLIDMNAKLTRATPDSQLNIQPIIDALASKDPNKGPTKFDLRINTVVIRRSTISYDVISVPADSTKLDINHLSINDFRADIQIPRLKNDDVAIDVRRIAFRGPNGFVVENLSGRTYYKPTAITIDDLVIDLPQTHLTLAPLKAQIGDGEKWGSAMTTMPLDVEILDGSYVTPSDLKAFLPGLEKIEDQFNLAFKADGIADNLDISHLNISAGQAFSLHTSGHVDGLMKGGNNIQIRLPKIDVLANGSKMADILKNLANVSPSVVTIIENAGNITINSDFKGSLSSGSLLSKIKTTQGSLDVRNDYIIRGKDATLRGDIDINDFNAASLLRGLGAESQYVGTILGDVDYDITIANRKVTGRIDALLDKLVYRDYTYRNVDANVSVDGTHYIGAVKIDNPEVALDLQADADLAPDWKTLDFSVDARNINLSQLNLAKRFPEHTLSLKGRGEIVGQSIDDFSGYINFNDIRYVNPADEGLRLKSISIISETDSITHNISLKSDIADAEIFGIYRLSTLPRTVLCMLERIFPQLLDRDHDAGECETFLASVADDNIFNVDVKVKDSKPVEALMKLPVSVIYPVDIHGSLNASSGNMRITLDAPYLQQGNKLIENTALLADVDGGTDNEPPTAYMYFTSLMPTKQGRMALAFEANGDNDRIDSELRWNVEKVRRFEGALNLTGAFSRNDEHQLESKIFINPSEMIFNDTVWTVEPATIYYADHQACIEDFKIGRPGQYLIIDGSASESDNDSIKLQLENINLGYIFDILAINHVTFGGNATGTFYASEIFSKRAHAYTEELNVKNFSYNNSLLGDGLIKSSWNPENQTIRIQAKIDQQDGRRSWVDGRILPVCDSLDFRFDTDRIPIGFLQPFMQAFATEVSGYASGSARLFGTFKDVDIVGDVYGEDVSMTIGFTNCKYTVTDSVHLLPGRIELNDLLISDIYGNTASLNGHLEHDYFKDPRFNFAVSNAKNLLVYDVKENPSLRWYGRVFGNGVAEISGAPGIVNIGVNMATAPNSTFTLVLSDSEEANEYKFITFRDRDAAKKDSIRALNAIPESVARLKERMAKNESNEDHSDYVLDIEMDATPQAQVNLLMDPVGGDKIRAYGNGNMRMNYDSANEDFKIFGTYTLSQGSYNFTLQDIIIKDFTIKDGSSISFHGNPYNAQLDIKAAYSVNANLSDLDESFLEDKELNRTNVPVHALLLLTGDMRQPDIAFDLEFPTLTQDTYRKVRSIVSTEEMMNRQIIYLLALNRFYTPEYMSATKGNELVSVASSTISSQLSSMLGQLSENWSIAPNFRSDRGDFSDMEVDLALSSHLLNNRLLLNGNFGYRDKTLNNNSFIGDFDIEYLLNRSGGIRLKAYNRYNDQNYYLKSALTTQGVGLKFKHDFDDARLMLFPWLRKKKTPADTIPQAIEPTDTITTTDR